MRDIGSFSKIISQLNVDEGDFILMWNSSRNIFQNSSQVEKMKIILC